MWVRRKAVCAGLIGFGRLRANKLGQVGAAQGAKVENRREDPFVQRVDFRQRTVLPVRLR